MLTDKVIELSMLIVISVGVYLSTFYSLKVTSQKHQMREESIKNEAREQLLQSELLSYEETVFTAKKSRHDLRHHNAVILEYLELGNIDEAKSYLCEQNEELAESYLKEFCKNPTCNAIFRLYERRATNKGVNFAVVADIPESLPLTAPELGAMLSNILENACEACEKSDLPNRHIAICAETDGERLLIELCNTVSEDTLFTDGMPVSQKEGGGTGTKSARDIVIRHNGMIEFSQNKSQFFTRIILPLN